MCNSKRKLDAFIGNECGNAQGHPGSLNDRQIVPPEIDDSQAVNGHKRQVKEGFSWWTCLQLGLPLSEAKPQAVSVKSDH
ncbi:hypothetical protein BsWGS_19625 [Bradybaena similaris]